jgi:hypothetical protein
MKPTQNLSLACMANSHNQCDGQQHDCECDCHLK